MFSWFRRPPKLPEPPEPRQPTHCNVGGGSGFHHEEWINLEGVASKTNPDPFVFSPLCRFPMKAYTMDTIYSSHVLEHLNDETVGRVLQESLRVLTGDGQLVIKIPDFVTGVDAWKRDDAEYYADYKWNFQAIATTFHNRGVPDTLTSRAAYMFCGFWNKAFGNLFDAYDPKAPGAYNGPPVLSQEELTEILSQESMHAVAARLRDVVLRNETDYTFNHQNAWSTPEFCALLERHGFTMRSTSIDEVVQRVPWIPTIQQNIEISCYYLATPSTPAERAARWAAHDAAIPRTASAASAAFDAKRLHTGAMGADLAERMHRTMLKEPNVPFRSADATPGYVTGEINEKTEREFNEVSSHRDSAAVRADCAEVLKALKDEVAAALGTPWSVLNCRTFVTPARAPAKNMTDWHNDGFCPHVFKIMVYLTPRTSEYGGIAMRIAGKEDFHEDSRPGSWILFDNTGIDHRGVPGTSKDRAAIEITLCRSKTFNIEPVFAGLNSHWTHTPPV